MPPPATLPSPPGTASGAPGHKRAPGGASKPGPRPAVGSPSRGARAAGGRFPQAPSQACQDSPTQAGLSLCPAPRPSSRAAALRAGRALHFSLCSCPQSEQAPPLTGKASPDAQPWPPGATPLTAPGRGPGPQGPRPPPPRRVSPPGLQLPPPLQRRAQPLVRGPARSACRGPGAPRPPGPSEGSFLLRRERLCVCPPQPREGEVTDRQTRGGPGAACPPSAPVPRRRLCARRAADGTGGRGADAACE